MVLAYPATRGVSSSMGVLLADIQIWRKLLQRHEKEQGRGITVGWSPLQPPQADCTRQDYALGTFYFYIHVKQSIGTEPLTVTLCFLREVLHWQQNKQTNKQKSFLVNPWHQWRSQPANGWGVWAAWHRLSHQPLARNYISVLVLVLPKYINTFWVKRD